MEEEINVRIEKNTVSIERSLSPIIYASWILGAGPARPKRWSKIYTVILRFVNFSICSVIVAYGAIDFFTFGAVFKSDIFKIMYYMNKVVCYISSYYYVYHGVRHYNKWPELMRKMNFLDEKLRREVRINDKSVKKAQIVALLMVIMFGPMSLVVHALYYYFILPKNIFASDLLLYYTIAQSLMNSFVFDINALVLRHMFARINCLVEQIDNELPPTWVALKIKQIRDLHSGVCGLVTLVNEIHGIQLLLSSANSFTMVVATLFRIYMGVVERNYEFMFINNIIWMIYTAQFAMTCWVCTLVCRESNKSGILIHEIGRNCKQMENSDKFTSLSHHGKQMDNGEFQLPEEQCFPRGPMGGYKFNFNYFGVETVLRSSYERDCARTEVNDFSLQLQHNRVLFSACELFEMNNALLNSFVGVITTYLIILVQFYRPEHHDDAPTGKES